MYKLYEIAPGQRLEIKEHPDASAIMVGLDAYGRSKIPNTMEIIYTGRGKDGRFLTGIDENSHLLGLLEFQAKNSDEKKAVKDLKAKTLKLRETLQTLTGNPDLSATSGFWETFKVPLHRIKFLDLSQTSGVLMANMLQANMVVMPDLAEPGNPVYFRSKFYFHTQEAEDDRSVKKILPLDKAKAALYGLFEGRDTKLLLIAHILFPEASTLDTMGFSTLYQQIRFHIESDKSKTYENAKEFNSLVLMDNTELTTRLIFRKASNRGLIKTIKNEYSYNGRKLGRTIEDAVRVLRSEEGQASLQELQDALSKTELV